jgi:hydrogenase nickel incorporation protein HypA/HybF
MHELSFADAIVEIAQRHACGRRVTRVRVRVGHLRQVVPDALEFAFSLLCTGTGLDGAELEIEAVAVRARCRRCGTETGLGGFPLQCPGCGDLDVEIVAGEELLVDELECEEEFTTEGMADGADGAVTTGVRR